MRYVFIFFVFVGLLTSCEKQQIYNVGEIYSIKENKQSYNPQGTYYIVKVLGHKGKDLYLCKYENRFIDRPKTIETEKFAECPILKTGNDALNSERGFKGTPLFTQQNEDFIQQEPELLAQIPITENEKQRVTDYKP